MCVTEWGSVLIHKCFFQTKDKAQSAPHSPSTFLLPLSRRIRSMRRAEKWRKDVDTKIKVLIKSMRDSEGTLMLYGHDRQRVNMTETLQPC